MSRKILEKFFIIENDDDSTGPTDLRGYDKKIPPPFEGPSTPYNHTQYCVCHGKNYIWITTYGTDPHSKVGTPIQGSIKVPCPYGYLRVNKFNSDKADDDEDWNSKWDF